eukprot:764780-Hanusia_phi.AAC.6
MKGLIPHPSQVTWSCISCTWLLLWGVSASCCPRSSRMRYCPAFLSMDSWYSWRCRRYIL